LLERSRDVKTFQKVWIAEALKVPMTSKLQKFYLPALVDNFTEASQLKIEIYPVFKLLQKSKINASELLSLSHCLKHSSYIVTRRLLNFIAKKPFYDAMLK